MQCRNCDFHNMPGSATCLRCGAILRLADAAIAIDPPRAPVWLKKLRRWLPFRREYYRLRGWWNGQRRLVAAALRDAGVPRLVPADAVRATVPGWPQIHARRARYGYALLAAWGLFVLLGLACYGSALSAILLGLVIAVHAGSVIDAFWRPNSETVSHAWVWALATLLLLSGGIYLPGIWTLGRWVESRSWLVVGEPLAAGDVLLASRLAYRHARPRPGDVVLFRLGRPVRLPVASRYRGAYLVENDAEWVDRVIAGPGCRVEWLDGELRVDGVLSALRPLNPARLPKMLTLQTPPDGYCVFPTVDPFLDPAAGEAVWASRSIVRDEDIVGRAIVRNYPPWRFTWLN